MVKKATKALLILGYEPDSECIFEPIGRRRDIDDGSCVIDVEIDVIYTKKIQELLPNLCESVKSIICEHVELEAEEILDKVAHKGEHVNKKARDIIMEYQHEQIMEEETDEAPVADSHGNRIDTARELHEMKARMDKMQILLDKVHNRTMTSASSI
tara:strand:- start:175 stop:642 length:468 start_codon:yes stop_codon:yes gene_type:complete